MRNKESVKQLQRYLIQVGATLPTYGADGDLGTETLKAIDSLVVPKYVKIALKEVGITEIVGATHNSRVLEYQATTAGMYTDDETPWCGAFVSWVMQQANIKHSIKVPERAKEWTNFGYAVNKPSMGSIAIKSRTGGGHVCIVVGINPNGKLYCVGGNQNNGVSIALYDASVFEAFRNISDISELCVVDLRTDTKTSEA